MQEFEEDYYAILGVEETAAAEEIRRAYIKLAKRLHPDRFPNDPDQRALAQREFAKVTRAHNIISDGEKRAEYDALRRLHRNKEQSELLSGQHLVGDVEAGQDEASNTVASPKVSASELQAITTTTAESNINVKWANKHLERADELLKIKQYQEAEIAMKEAIRLVPKDPKYHNKLAEVYQARGWYTLAMTEVQTALRMDPRDTQARNLETQIKSKIKEQEITRADNKAKQTLMGKIKGLFSKK
ncbi:MAG: DnaJ domain-containing protein [Candidatus Melainabacteria bacterium]|nr:MAG: DnaJ domain-containing protein [Candidatus Melainabacteria bacterium]